MKVLKFGGSSIASASRMKEVAQWVRKENGHIIVFSALAGTTNRLIEIADYLYRKNPDGANEIINQLESEYLNLAAELYATHSYTEKAQELLKERFNEIRAFTKDLFTLFEEKIILAQGELISSAMMCLLLEEQKTDVALIPALDFMRTDKNSEPDPVYIREKLHQLMKSYPDSDIYVTQGYICRNAYGETDNLGRHGSDLTASLIGVAVQAEEIQIWTNVDVMQNNDPHYVSRTTPVERLEFEEAAELAYFGARMLHPTCILPAKLSNIPVRLLNTAHPEGPGTLVSNRLDKGKIKAVAAKDNITSIRIKSGRMLLAYGFLRKVFEIFENYRTSIDMVTTSEVGVSVTIDNAKHLPEILDDLKKYGTVSVCRDMTIICVVGDLDRSNLGFESKAVNALKDIPVQMISYGGSNYNISFLIDSRDKKQALQALSNNLFK
ncbi:MAG: aspartate kinase [Dysgonamonadaceae bacterium]|jgi:aspartate kinase|nr:aspartate kinase [Dysgonamonadaceae bacterium]